MKTLQFVFLAFTMVNVSLCWWDTGHMLVAKIAEITLTQEERLTNILNIFSHNQVTNFVESACWPDDVKTFGLKSMDEWHFIDLPVKFPSPLNHNLNITYKPDDALGTLHACYRVLSSWTEMEKATVDTQIEKSMMARYLVHVLGDIHQPLHASSLFSEKFPNGDQGGNLYLIKFKDGIDNLHKLFDSGLDYLSKTMKRPLNKTDHDYLTSLANEIVAEYPADSLAEMNNTDFADWVEESKDISQNFIYKGLSFEGSPSEEFLETAYQIVRKRIALGGYRLAHVFRQIKKAFDRNNRIEFLK